MSMMYDPWLYIILWYDHKLNNSMTKLYHTHYRYHCVYKYYNMNSEHTLVLYYKDREYDIPLFLFINLSNKHNLKLMITALRTVFVVVQY